MSALKSRYVHPRTIRRLAEKSLRREKQSRKDREAAAAARGADTVHPMAERCARCGHPRGQHSLLFHEREMCEHMKQDQRRGCYVGCLCAEFIVARARVGEGTETR